MKPAFRFGQTSVEYLMIMAVVLVVALIAIGLSLFFTQSSGDVLQSETVTYWSTQVPPPFRILEMQGYYYSGTPGTGELALVFQNVDTKPAYLRNLVLTPNDGTNMELWDNHSTSGSSPSCCDLGAIGPGVAYGSQPNITFAPSQKKTLYVRVTYACSNAGTTSTDSTTRFYDNLTIYYDSPYYTQLSFTGIKPIQGRCNPI
ncbi:MAG: class III signal peptide-containing protein [Candidatus Micrarchaeota archaeon]|nr:class III signal peptide-containing protein [Candidatus Micrarchaeota archaeon]